MIVLFKTMTDAVLIAAIGAVATVITTLITHKAVRRVERATNGLMADRDKATTVIAHAAGKAEQRAEDASKSPNP